MIDWTQAINKFVIQDEPYFIIHYVIKLENNKITVKNIRLPSYLQHQDVISTLLVNLMSENFRIMTDLEKIKYL